MLDAVRARLIAGGRRQVEADDVCPALTRLAAIGPPMLPRPMKAMLVMRILPFVVRFFKPNVSMRAAIMRCAPSRELR